MNSLGVGRKGQKQRRMRQYHSSNKVTSSIHQSPFSEIWHNNKPLEILYVRDIPESKCFCTYCSNEFPRGPVSVAPFFDIALSHEERWKYLNCNRKSPNDPEYLACAINKYTKRFYCVRKECFYGRFPYFSSNFITYANVNLNISHKQLLKEQLNIEIA